MDYEENKKQRKEMWMNENSYKSQLLGPNIIPMNPKLGFYIIVNNLEISQDFFKEEYEQVCEAHSSVMKKLNEYYKKHLMNPKPNWEIWSANLYHLLIINHNFTKEDAENVIYGKWSDYIYDMWKEGRTYHGAILYILDLQQPWNKKRKMI